MRRVPITEALGEDLVAAAANRARVAEARMRATRYRAQSSIPGCWIWPGGLSGGYGHVTYRVDGAKVDAKLHILLYELFVGPVPDGLLLDHRCRERRCCNPDCLEPVTNRVNVIRGVHGRAREAAIRAGQIELVAA